MDSRASCEGINREGRLADRVDTAQVRPQGHRTTFRIPARSAREVAGLKCARTFSRSIAAKKPSSLVASAMTWSAIALLLCPPTVTTVSPGYCRPVLLVNGTTTTRARFRLAALLLTMTA